MMSTNNRNKCHQLNQLFDGSLRHKLFREAINIPLPHNPINKSAIMNATRIILLRPRVLPKGQRSLHAVNAKIDASGMKNSQGTHKQSQNNFFVAAAMEEQMPAQSPFAQPSAKDIQQLLSNIGAEHRASLHTIESMIQKNVGDGTNGVIDLIAQIRSI